MAIHPARWSPEPLCPGRADALQPGAPVGRLLPRGIAFTQVCQIIPLDTEIALAAAEACRTHKLATADAVIFATAQTQEATLLTCDTHFGLLPGVTLIEKIKA